MTLPNFIIGGTEKAGTTSVFTYLLSHPEVCGSKVKETDFFRRDDCSDRARSLQTYAGYFAHCEGRAARIVMEASPGYLGESRLVAPRMRALLENVRLLFILRHPVDRLYSSFNFHKARLDLPAALDFEQYVDKCLCFDRGTEPEALGIGRWYLQVLRFGCYAQHLEPFLELFPRAHVKIMFYEELQRDEGAFMKQLCGFLGIEAAFFDQYDFKPANVTFSSRFEWLHKQALALNQALEPVLRARPELKRAVVSAYKKLNQAREGYPAMAAPMREQLQAYYSPSIAQLVGLVGESALPPSWRAGLATSAGQEPALSLR